MCHQLLYTTRVGSGCDIYNRYYGFFRVKIKKPDPKEERT